MYKFQAFQLYFYLLHFIILNTTAYDSGLQFTPTGRILQLEYAKDAVSLGGPVIGVKCSDGTIFVCARKINKSKLRLKHTQKLFFVDDHICVAATGLLFDAKVLVDACRKLASNYRSIFGAPIPVEKLTSDLAALIHRTSRIGNSRPFGAGLLISGWDSILGPQLYRTDPEGSFDAWRAVSIGKDSVSLYRALDDLGDVFRGNANVCDTWKALRPVLRKHFSPEYNTPQKTAPQTPTQSTSLDSDSDSDADPSKTSHTSSDSIRTDTVSYDDGIASVTTSSDLRPDTLVSSTSPSTPVVHKVDSDKNIKVQVNDEETETGGWELELRTTRQIVNNIGPLDKTMDMTWDPTP
eukprot:gene5679-11460_t